MFFKVSASWDWWRDEEERRTATTSSVTFTDQRPHPSSSSHPVKQYSQYERANGARQYLQYKRAIQECDFPSDNHLLVNGATVKEQTYQQISYPGNRISVGPDDCFALSQVLLVPDDEGKMRIAVSVGTGPLRVKFMKEAR
jgi:hypothetical protein